MSNKSFKQLLRESLKSKDTEEWLDVHFTRPVGLVFALMWNRMGIHPNVITILSIFLGLGAGWYFHYTDLYHNVLAIVLLIFADFCDSTDGQMARLANKRTLLGRALDGFSGDVWFFAIYFAVAYRLMFQNIPGLDIKWGWFSWLLCLIAGLMCHSPQSSLADYYRQIHLYFLKGKEGSELDNSADEQAKHDSLPKSDWFGRLFYKNYAKYCRSQERRTPKFQRFFKLWTSGKGDAETRSAVREQLLSKSRPLMPYTNILTFNTRAIVLYLSALVDMVWIYPLFEITVMTGLYLYMHKTHETMCEELTKQLESK
ncbi:MAG: CDP-alcohol phosphatidyltransferase family protein [Prevotella sp.]|jgi:hypothetical protein